MIAAISIVLLGESFTAFGQILLKRSTNKLETPALKSIGSYFAFARNVLRLRGIWLGLLFMAVGLIIWLIALSWFELSLVFPIGSVQYVLVLFASRVFLNEKITWMKLTGTFLIVVGIVGLAFS
jgi:drug/metabolite transporter (DMT)-like permease